LVSSEKQPQVKVLLQKGKEQEEQEYDLDMLIDVKGWRAIGNKLSSHPVLEINLIQSEAKTAEEESIAINEDSPKTETDLEVGSTVDFKIKKEEEDKDQLGLF
jgi:topoisomerase IV subunit A